MDSIVIRTEGLSKFYGKHRGLEGLDLEVARGEIFGFLGPNGAGKTTTIRLLLDLIRPTAGRATVLGLDTHADSLEIRSRVGYLPGELSLYENMTGREMLEFFAGLRGTEDLTYAETFAERLGLDLSRPIAALSKGNKQKVGLTQAFMHKPELLILDEPTSGLDPLVQNEFHNIIRESASEGATIFLSSHVLSEVQEIAHRVAIIREGSLVVVDEIAALKRKAVRRIEIRFGDPIDPSDFTGLPGVRDARVDGTHAHFVVEGSIDALVKAAARYEVIDLVSQEPDLEEIFLTYYAGPDGR